MSSDIFFNSVIKGLGKTTGSMIVLGVIGGAFLYLSSSPRKVKTKKRIKETKETQTNNEVQLENVDEILEIPEVQEKQIHFLESENTYKHIFDKL
jgi:replication-associated recombination protein RarA